MQRRELLKSGATAVAAATVAAIATSESRTAQGQEPQKSPQPPVQGAGIETQTGQAIYKLPRDHAWHGGAFYQSNEYNEWHSTPATEMAGGL